MRSSWQIVLIAIALAGPHLAHADDIYLRGGAKLEGRATREGDTVVVRMESGEVRLPSETVERIETRVSHADVVERKRAALRADDIEGRLELAAYCREHDLRATERALLLEVLDRAPNHARARRLLGFVKTDAGWVDRSRELQAERDADQRARLERMHAEARDAERAKAEREVKQAELEAQRAREDAARARAEAAAAQQQPYLWAPANYEPRGRRPERRQTTPQASPAPSFPINGARDPRDGSHPLNGTKDPRDW